MFRNVTVPMDPIINVIAQDVATNPSFHQSVLRLQNKIIPYQGTIHPSDELLEAWYSFKENRTCQP